MNRVIDGHGYGRDPHPDEAMRIKDELVRQYLEIDPTESAWWKLMQRMQWRGQEAAAKMREAGIPGIRYLDQGSALLVKGKPELRRFDDNIIDILKSTGSLLAWRLAPMLYRTTILHHILASCVIFPHWET